MQRLELGLAAACGASVLYDVAVALQAVEARRVPVSHSLRPSLLRRLLRSPLWVGATVVGVLGWPLQVAALLLAPLTVVQPALAAGLLLLLFLGVRVLGEPAGRRELAAVIAIVVGVGGIAWAAPEHTTSHAPSGRLAVALAILAVVAAAPFLVSRARAAASLIVVLGAGAAYAWTGLSSKLLADQLASHAWPAALAWAVATGLAALLGLLSEMTALQRRPATVVAPVVFVVQMVVPVLLAPLLGGESWSSTPLGGGAIAIMLATVGGGTAMLAASPAVAALVGSLPQELADGDAVEAGALQVARQ
jgi:drug/metabolite transporter (DMT)-like permease